MAAADYTIRGSGPITLRATLGAAVTPGDTVFSLTDLSNQLIDPVAGMGVMIDEEICRVVSSTLSTMTVARGCADTIPTEHDADTLIWFFDNAVGTDGIEYGAGETVGVKVLMHTTTREMGLNDAPPNQLTFVGRFARPYPPGNLRIAGTPWHEVVNELGEAGLTHIELTWAHRNRVTQSDQLIGHEVGDVTPEVGQTYEIIVRKADNTLVRSITGITGTSYNYTIAEAVADLAPVTPGTPKAGYLQIQSARDGHTSYQKYRIDFTVTVTGFGTGWGESWGT